MKALIIVAGLFFGFQNAQARIDLGLNGGEFSVPTLVMRCSEGYVDHGIIVDITMGGLSGETLATVQEVTIAGAKLIGQYVISQTSIVDVHPIINLMEGTGIELSVATTPISEDNKHLFGGEMKFEVEDGIFSIDMTCTYPLEEL